MIKKNISELRIIAGDYRSRKIFFEAENGLRPTHNRIRETVFNWLQSVIENSLCLDAFAGSGAMGFEALSRGAKQVVFCDISKNVIQNLKKNAIELKIMNVDFYQCDFVSKNPVVDQQFDVVFLDPPFQKNVLVETCALLEERNLLKPNAFIYCEFQKDSVDITQFPENWIIKKQQETQTIVYMLFMRA
ncbi:MAG: 16S rRNA (guanine(966)-N(2))-methyltransferase RsmD [Coxiellaceae bacterium]|nr:16S rRNA (guanine(966)-N(2))-methyltransferase RsmD [Coxiellaceae bacterium]